MSSSTAFFPAILPDPLEPQPKGSPRLFTVKKQQQLLFDVTLAGGVMSGRTLAQNLGSEPRELEWFMTKYGLPRPLAPKTTAACRSPKNLSLQHWDQAAVIPWLLKNLPRLKFIGVMGLIPERSLQRVLTTTCGLPASIAEYLPTRSKFPTSGLWQGRRVYVVTELIQYASLFKTPRKPRPTKSKTAILTSAQVCAVLGCDLFGLTWFYSRWGLHKIQDRSRPDYSPLSIALEFNHWSAKAFFAWYASAKAKGYDLSVPKPDDLAPESPAGRFIDDCCRQWDLSVNCRVGAKRRVLAEFPSLHPPVYGYLTETFSSFKHPDYPSGRYIRRSELAAWVQRLSRNVQRLKGKPVKFPPVPAASLDY